MDVSVSNMPWVDAYEPHVWKVYEISIDSGDDPPTRTIRDMTVCNTSSIMAAELWRGGVRREVFYSDFEQIAADLEGNSGSEGELRRLIAPWNGHPIGALVHKLHRGVDKGFFTWMIEAV